MNTFLQTHKQVFIGNRTPDLEIQVYMNLETQEKVLVQHIRLSKCAENSVDKGVKDIKAKLDFHHPGALKI